MIGFCVITFLVLNLLPLLFSPRNINAACGLALTTIAIRLNAKTNWWDGEKREKQNQREHHRQVGRESIQISFSLKYPATKQRRDVSYAGTILFNDTIRPNCFKHSWRLLVGGLSSTRLRSRVFLVEETKFFSRIFLRTFSG